VIVVVRCGCDVWGVDEGLPLAHALSTLCLLVVVEQCIVVDFTKREWMSLCRCRLTGWRWHWMAGDSCSCWWWCMLVCEEGGGAAAVACAFFTTLSLFTLMGVAIACDR
jgi:hypothetical protein